jgi:hydrogenase expression/formation protein HypD
MPYHNQSFRDPALAQQLITAIHAARQPQRHYRLMEFCGGHTQAIFKFGLPQQLAPAIEFIHGPGCPVCVLPIARLNQALVIAQNPNVILCSYGDLLRVPASDGLSLLTAKAAGADVRIIYSTQDALALARQHPQRQVVLLAIGFETTAPATAVALRQAHQERLANFSILCNHVCTDAALTAILKTHDVQIDGIIGPAHVSTIIGSQAYQFVGTDFQIPVVITGFEPTDLLYAILRLIQQINNETWFIENQYRRAVTEQGNQQAQQLLATSFIRRDQFAWRGLGWLPLSGFRLAPAYAEFDAEQRFPMTIAEIADPPGCACADIICGRCTPIHCPLFATACTPDHPIGACMVSAEGACAAYWRYQRH